MAKVWIFIPNLGGFSSRNVSSFSLFTSSCKILIMLSVITRPEDIRTFHSDSKFHNKAKSSNAGWFFHQILGECMGLINGDRWTQIRSEFNSYFTHKAVILKTDETSCYAKRHIQSWETTYPTSFTAKAAEVVTRYPFFCTAASLYGDLDDKEKEILWTLGQRSLGLMGHVLSGGFQRFWFAPLLYKKATQELDDFMEEWTAFNHTMFEKRRYEAPSLPIVSVWQKVLDGELDQKEVRDLKQAFFNIKRSRTDTDLLRWFTL